MSLGSVIKSLNKSLDHYHSFLKNLSEEDFQQTPSAEVWSYAEVYAHILKADLSSLIAIERCIHAKKPTPGGTNLVTRAILFFGKFPPGKLKTPEQAMAQVTKISKEEASNLLIKVREKINQLIPGIAKAPKNYKANHPRLGMLNARQWLRFIEIHTEHHIKQLDKIANLLNNK